jgi:hypothetical protein
MNRHYIILIVGLTLFLSGCAGWTKEEKITQGIYTALHVADWMQTRAIADEPKRFYETNAVLGRHPEQSAVDAYFTATLIGHYLIADALPRRWTVPGTAYTVNPRGIWQWFWIGVEANCVRHNHAIGVRVRF